jgi:hypothetical protein
VVGSLFRSTHGFVPKVGSSVLVRTQSGVDRSLTVRAVVERVAMPGGLLVNSRQADALIGENGTRRVLVLAAGNKSSLSKLQRELGAALLGRTVGTVSVFSTIRPLETGEVFLRYVLLTAMLFDVFAAGVLVWRWADERRRLLLSSRSAAIGPAFLARSINQDATAHVGSASVLGAVAGVGLGWVLLQPGSRFQLPWLMLLAAVTVPTLVAAVVARFPSSPSSSRSGAALGAPSRATAASRA